MKSVNIVPSESSKKLKRVNTLDIKTSTSCESDALLSVASRVTVTPELKSLSCDIGKTPSVNSISCKKNSSCHDGNKTSSPVSGKSTVLSTPERSPSFGCGMLGSTGFKNRKSPGGMKNIDNLATKLMDDKVKSIAQQNNEVSSHSDTNSRPIASTGLLTKAKVHTPANQSTPSTVNNASSGIQRTVNSHVSCQDVKPILETLQEDCAKNVATEKPLEDVSEQPVISTSVSTNADHARHQCKREVTCIGELLIQWKFSWI